MSMISFVGSLRARMLVASFLIALATTFADISSGFAQGVDTVEIISFDIVEFKGRLGHENFLPIAGQPIIASEAIARVRLAGPFDAVTFSLVTPEGDLISEIDLELVSKNSLYSYFFGPIEIPDTNFKLAVSGIDTGGNAFEIAEPSNNAKFPDTVTIDFPTAPFAIPTGTTTIVGVVKNYGDSDEFHIDVTDTLAFISRGGNSSLSLGEGETGFFRVDITVPEPTPDNTKLTLTAIVESLATPIRQNSTEVGIRVETLDTLPVIVDVKPGTCRNPINTTSQGKVPIAILGSADLDVTTIKPETAVLGGGVVAVKFEIKDVGDIDPANCGEKKGDKFPDLVLLFNVPDLVTALQAQNVNLDVGALVRFPVTAQTVDGLTVTGADVVQIIH